jgi:hypothetical protein
LYPLVEYIFIALDELLNEEETSQSICSSVVHNKKQKNTQWCPQEHHFQGDLIRKVNGEASVISYIVINCFLTTGMRRGKLYLLQDVFTGGVGVLPAVSKPALVGRVAVDQDTSGFGIKV